MNPSASHIQGTKKQHKHQKPVRSIGKWKGSLGYKLAKLTDTLLKETIQLRKVYNIQNSTKLIHNLNYVNIKENIKLFDRYHKYLHECPLAHVTNIIKSILNNNKQVSKKNKHELLTMLSTLLEQNYIQLNNQYYKQNDGLAMRAPMSAVIPAEVFIQYLEHTKIIEILKEYIIDCFQYVDDILIV
jgi:hypothetical protein